MYIHYDPDEWEVKSECKPCTVCHGDLKKCNGACNGSAAYWTERRTPDEVAAIKAKKQREHEDAVLAEAKFIKAMRGIKD